MVLTGTGYMYMTYILFFTFIIMTSSDDDDDYYYHMPTFLLMSVEGHT